MTLTPLPRPQILPEPCSLRGSSAEGVAILYENDAWLGDLFERLRERGVPFQPIPMQDAAHWLDDPPAVPLAFNKVSPSSYVRGHGPAIPFARALLDVLSLHGRRVVNGARAFRHETSKVAQHLLYAGLGIPTPRTLLFNARDGALAAARGFPFPAILKPDCGGSGAYVHAVDSPADLAELLASEREAFGPDHLLLLQERIDSTAGIVRTEFVDGELVYAMRVFATNTFNLCPADTCEREAADATASAPPKVDFEPYPDIPAAAVAQGREILRAAELDVGGVEFIEAPDGRRVVIDVNATSVYRPEICRAFGVDGLGKLVDFLERELYKEIAKGGAARRIGGRAG